MGSLIRVVIAGFLTYTVGSWFDLDLFPDILIFIGLYGFLGALKKGPTGGIWNSGLWTTKPVRRVVGAFADGILFIVGIVAFFTLVALLHLDWLFQAMHKLPGFLYVIAFLVLLTYQIKAVVWLEPRVKGFIGRLIAPISRLLRSRFIGMGGSSTFGGLFNDWAHKHKPGQLILGGSLYSSDWVVGRSDDRHFITIATSRSGKGRSAIVPNLLTWLGSALVIDPKGQNAAITAAARGKGGGRVTEFMGQSVRIVDPFGELKKAGVDIPVHRFNPLAELRPDDLDFVEQVHTLTDALVVPDSRGETFWDSSARNLISGVIAQLLTHPAVRAENKTLLGLREYLKHVAEEDYLTPMRENVGRGGLPAAAAAKLDQLAENARGDVIGTALTHTDWLDSVAMQATLQESDFSLAELKATPTTLYLVLPPQYLDVHSRFLRLFVNLAVQAVGQGRKPVHPVLFVLDEFYALGRLQLVAKAAGLLAGYGVKLWPIVQNLGQLQELYPDNWETFLGNAGMWQVFAVNDQTTARYLSERLGQHIVWKKHRTFDGQKYVEEWIPQGVSILRTGGEFSQETSRDSGNQVIFVEGADSFLLERRPYDLTFAAKQYSPDPFESGAATTMHGRLKNWVENMDEKVEQKGDYLNNKVENWLERKELEWNQRKLDKKQRQAQK